MPCFPWTGVGRLPAGQLMGANQWALMLVYALLAMLLIPALSYAIVRFVHHGLPSGKAAKRTRLVSRTTIKKLGVSRQAIISIEKGHNNECREHIRLNCHSCYTKSELAITVTSTLTFSLNSIRRNQILHGFVPCYFLFFAYYHFQW